jgi:hypothetical protein
VSHWKAGSHAVISHAGERNIKEHTAEIAHSQARHLTGGGNRTWCYVAPPYRVQANRPSRLYVLETVVSLANRTTHGGISDSSMWTLPCYRRESPCREHLSRWCRNPSVVVSVTLVCGDCRYPAESTYLENTYLAGASLLKWGYQQL